MAVVNEKSTQVTNIDATPITKIAVNQWMGRLRMFFFDYTRAAQGDAGSVASLIDLPGGEVRLVLPLSFIQFSAMGAARTMDLGWQAYTDNNGDTVAADPNGLDDGIDVSSAGTVVPGGTLAATAGETHLFSNRGGVRIDAQINDDTFDAAETLSGFFVAVVD